MKIADQDGPKRWLHGLRVLDFSSNVAGPIATLTLARLGADVIKIERLDGDPSRYWAPYHEGESLTFHSLNRAKRSVAIDLKAAEARALISDLVRQAHIIVHNFGPGVAARLGLDEDSIRHIAPDVVYCSVGAFGSGPEGRRIPGYDPVAQAFTGILEMTGYADGPAARCAPSAIDISTGQWVVIGVLTSLLAQARPVAGAEPIASVEATLVDSAMGFIPYQASAALLTGKRPVRHGTANPLGAPHQVFPTKDRLLFLGAPSQDKWVTLCRVLSADGLADDPRFSTAERRLQNVAALETELSAILVREPAAYWRERLLAAGIAVSEVLHLDETVAHPLAGERKWFEGEVPMLRLPLLINDQVVPTVGDAPALGEHSVEVLEELGFERELIDRLVASGIVVQA